MDCLDYEVQLVTEEMLDHQEVQEHMVETERMVLKLVT